MIVTIFVKCAAISNADPVQSAHIGFRCCRDFSLQHFAVNASTANTSIAETAKADKLVGKALDVLNVLLVNFVRDICSVGDLVDVVCDITRKIAESLHLIFVNVDDVSFKDHRTGAILKK